MFSRKNCWLFELYFHSLVCFSSDRDPFRVGLITLTCLSGGGIIRDVLLKQPIAAFTDPHSQLPLAMAGAYSYIIASALQCSRPTCAFLGAAVPIALRQFQLLLKKLYKKNKKNDNKVLVKY